MKFNKHIYLSERWCDDLRQSVDLNVIAYDSKRETWYMVIEQSCLMTWSQPTWLSISDQDISYVNIPVKYLDVDGKTIIKDEAWPMIDIHNTMGYLFQDGGLNIPSESLVDFWEKSKEFGEEFAQELDYNEMSVTVPIGVYGDSARVDFAHGSEHILAFFTNCLLWRPLSVRWSRFLICCISEERLTSATIPAILRRVVWSANHAFSGVYPSVGPKGEALTGNALKRAGQALAGGLRFQTCELRGDWSFHKKIWRFSGKTHWNGEHVCHLCTAKGISDNVQELYFNIENNTHVEFTLPQFLARRVPAQRVWH